MKPACRQFLAVPYSDDYHHHSLTYHRARTNLQPGLQRKMGLQISLGRKDLIKSQQDQREIVFSEQIQVTILSPFG